MKRWLTILMALVVCCMTMVLPVYAAEQPSVSIPVTIDLKGDVPYTPEDYTVVLSAEDAAYPMPEGSKDGAYRLTITGKDTEKFPAMTYDRVGVYTYKIYQVAGNNKLCSYDKTVYTLIVTITNNADYTGLEATAVLYPNSVDVKTDKAIFVNDYKVAPSTDAPQTGDASTPMLYAVLTAVSIGVIAGLFLTRKSKKIEE